MCGNSKGRHLPREYNSFDWSQHYTRFDSNRQEQPIQQQI